MTYSVLDETITEKDELGRSFGQVHSGVGGTLLLRKRDSNGFGVQQVPAFGFVFVFIAE
jgi:hypothetical protein